MFSGSVRAGGHWTSLKYRTTRGMALTPIRMASLNEDEDSPNDEESTRRYLESCRRVEYVHVDQGQCRFWTPIVVTSDVVRTEPD